MCVHGVVRPDGYGGRFSLYFFFLSQYSAEIAYTKMPLALTMKTQVLKSETLTSKILTMGFQASLLGFFKVLFDLLKTRMQNELFLSSTQPVITLSTHL